jgi:hypothetical protein
MISIVICHNNLENLNEFKRNVTDTIGVPSEFIIINNTKNNLNIFQAYNIGVEQSKYDIICFSHEDVYFYTNDWGKKVTLHFQDSRVGIIGVLGSHFMPKSPSGWNHPRVSSGGVYQGNVSNGVYYKEPIYHLDYLKNKQYIDAVVVDGLWFCIRRSLFNTIKFDEQTFKGFHCYDLDICFQVRKENMKVRIVSDIIVEHRSNGIINEEWIENSRLLYNKWKDYLPQLEGIDMSIEEIKIRELFVQDVIYYLEEFIKCRNELKSIRNSKAYNIGKRVTKPWYLINKIFNFLFKV